MTRDVLRAWRALPTRLQAAVRDLPPRALDARDGPDTFSIRMWVHHLVEANLVASCMVVDALGTDGGTFDWSWLWPDAAWCRKLGYERAPLGPALDALRGLTRHVAGLVAASDGGLRRKVRLFDAPGARTYGKTVEEILAGEVAHAREHLAEVARLRARHTPRRARRGSRS